MKRLKTKTFTRYLLAFVSLVLFGTDVAQAALTTTPIESDYTFIAQTAMNGAAVNSKKDFDQYIKCYSTNDYAYNEGKGKSTINGTEYFNTMQIKDARGLKFSVAAPCTVTVYGQINGERYFKLGTADTKSDIAACGTEGGVYPIEITEEWVNTDIYLSASGDLYLAGLVFSFASEETPEVPSVVTFDFNVLGSEYGYGVSTGSSHDGDIADSETFEVDGVKLTASTNTATTPTRFWSYNNLTELRFYKSSAMTIDAGERTITKIVYTCSKWDNNNTFNPTSTSSESKVWTGEASTVGLTIGGTTQINSVTVYFASDDPLAEVKADLQATINEMEKIALDGYTAESVQNFKNAIAAAKAALEAADATEESLTKAKEDMIAARNALVKEGVVLAGDGSEANPWNVAAALQASAWLESGKNLNDGADVYVTGVIKYMKEMSTSYGNATYSIVDNADDTDTLLVYRGYGLDGEKFVTGEEIAVGDIVVVCGQITNYSGTIEFTTGNKLVSIKKAGTDDPKDPAEGDDIIELTTDMYYEWDGFGADASPIGAGYCENNIGKEVNAGATVIGDGSVNGKHYADLTGCSKLVFEGTAGTNLRVLFNRQSMDGSSNDFVEKTTTIGEDGTAELDLADLPYVHLNVVKIPWDGSTGVKVTAIKMVKPSDPLEIPKEALKKVIALAKMHNAVAKTAESFAALTKAIEDAQKALEEATTAEELEAAQAALTAAIDGLQLAEGYAELTKEMYNNAYGAYALFESTGLPYGDSNVDMNNYADLSEYDQLVVSVAAGTPRFCFNRATAAGQDNADESLSEMIDIPGQAWGTERYQTISEDNAVYTINLAKMTEEKGKAWLHCIKGAYYANVTVTGMYLYKAAGAEEPEVPAEWSIDFVAVGSNHTDKASVTISEAVANIGGTDMGTCTVEDEALNANFVLQTGTSWLMYGGGLYQFNSGGRAMGMLNCTAGQIITIVVNDQNGGLGDPNASTNVTLLSCDEDTHTYKYTVNEDGDVKFTPARYQYFTFVSVTNPVEDGGGDFGDASIEGEWKFDLDWHYAGGESRGKVTDIYTATLDGNTVTFTDEWEDRPIVAEFTAENTLTFKKAIVGNPAAQKPLTQNPFTDGSKVTDAGIDSENFVFETFTATYDPEAGTITFAEGTGLAYGYADKETGEFSYYIDAVDFIAATKAGGEEPATVRRWDFTTWSEATVANLKADAAQGYTNGWSDVEKNGDTEPTEATKDNCFWSINTPDEIGGLSANKVLIDELKGLKFAATAKDRALAIAVNYPTTSLGDYNGGAYLWLGGSNKQFFTIPAVAGGSTIKMGVESHKSTDARGVDILVNGESIGSFTPTTYEEYTWTVPAGEAVNVVVDNTNGCHVYFIEVEQDQEALLAVAKADLETVINAVSEIDTDLYTEETVAALAAATEDAQAAQWSNDIETITEATYALLNAKAALELYEEPVPVIMTYVVKEVAGDIVFRTTEGEAEEGTAIKVAYRKYNADENGNLYTKAATSKEYNYSFTLTTDAQEETIEYSETGIENVVFIAEGEDLEGLEPITTGNAAIRSSNSAAGHAAEDTEIVTLEAGVYTVHAVMYDSTKGGGEVFTFKAGEQENQLTAGENISEGEFELTLTETTAIVLAANSASNKGLDAIYVVRTGDVTTGINTVGAQSENGAVYNLQGQKVMKAQKGLYIINGKKVVVK